ncbi:MAG TPA: hypothetical protein GX706_04625, partial [Candidatus Moranbacteria bacterium]|nr:hypothetical protein [Candidatus Moranbacteria bacterium]
MRNILDTFLKRILSSRYLSYWVVLAADVFVSVLSTFIACLAMRHYLGVYLLAGDILLITMLSLAMSLIAFVSFST